MSRAQEQFNRMNERLTARPQISAKLAPFLVLFEMLWLGVIFSLIIAGLLTGLCAFILLVGGLVVPFLLIRYFKRKFDRAAAHPAPASEQIIDHDQIKTDKDGSPFID